MVQPSPKPLLQALRGIKHPRPPVWIMRQAGRYLPEYRELRARHEFLDVCYTPELACEVTLQPLRRFSLDAAILFSDILVPLVPMGMDLRFGKDHGPVFDNPLQSQKDVENLRVLHGDDCPFVGQALELIARELPAQTTLIGFAGAPFTLASYMVEGQGTKTFQKIKSLMYSQPETFSLLMEKLVASTIAYLEMQVAHGAEVLQLFDSWGGQLDPADYGKFAHPYSEKILDHFAKKKAPVIHFVKHGGGLLPHFRSTLAAGLGVSWEYSMKQAVETVPDQVCLQGNLDPATLLGPQTWIREKTSALLEIISGSPHSHIFNLGHGILPQTPVENVSYLMELIQDFSNE